MLSMKSNGTGGRGAKPPGKRSVAPAERDGTRMVPSPELTERPKRRRFSAEYKLRILSEAAACSRPGEIGALLRREGLYSSHLTTWRQQRDHGAHAAFSGRRGPKPNLLAAENAQLRRRAERAEAELAKARKVIEVQGKVSALLGIVLEANSATADEPPPSPRSGRRSSKV
jgi:transposase-like protein